MKQAILVHAVGKGLLVSCVSWWKKLQLLKSKILTRFITYTHQALNCNSKNTVYLIECNQCRKQYTGSSKTKFRYRANNYKSTHRKFKNKKQVPKEALKQKVFHEHFCLDDYNGIQDWVITLIEQVDDEKFLRQRELFWAHKLDTFYPNGLNQRDIYAAY